MCIKIKKNILKSLILAIRVEFNPSYDDNSNHVNNNSNDNNNTNNSNSNKY